MGYVIRKKREKHGMTGTRFLRIYNKMRERCLSKTSPDWDNYGGRGIKIYPEWIDSFEEFKKDMYPSYKKSGCKLEIDRVDNNGDYTPSNCRWATRKQQTNNTRKNVYYQLGTKEYTLSELSDLSGVSYSTLKQRLRKLNWSVEKAISEPPKETTPIKKYLYNGEMQTIPLIAKSIGMSGVALRRRIKKHGFKKAIEKEKDENDGKFMQELFFYFEGKNRHLSEIAEMVGMKYGTLNNRIRRLGWSPEEAFKTKVQKYE